MTLTFRRTRELPVTLAAASALLAALFLASQPVTRAQQAEAPSAPEDQQASSQTSTPSSSVKKFPAESQKMSSSRCSWARPLLAWWLSRPDPHLQRTWQARGHSPEGSFTLSLIEIDRVHLSRHKVELEGIRYGLHFLGACLTKIPQTHTTRSALLRRRRWFGSRSTAKSSSSRKRQSPQNPRVTLSPRHRQRTRRKPFPRRTPLLKKLRCRRAQSLHRRCACSRTSRRSQQRHHHHVAGACQQCCEMRRRRFRPRPRRPHDGRHARVLEALLPVRRL